MKDRAWYERLEDWANRRPLLACYAVMAVIIAASVLIISAAWATF